MSDKLPPNPIGVPPGSSYWNDWYEKLRTLVDSITSSIGTGPLLRQTGSTLTDANITGTLSVGGVPTINATLALAKITLAGTDGSATFVRGLLTTYVPPT